ncbi:MAG: xanthine dehydrogenase family protein molybdopterin-binding subunit [Anaerolineae bacterium]|nr:xanthine dehydrogenase family protein molybdopterin-binding subunit [Anaerolineae bacterium]
MAMAREKLTFEPVGKSVPRVDGFDKVTGAAQFTDDLQFGPGLLYGRVLRSPHPHALITGIDASKALALPGVKAVITGQDTPGFIGLYLKDRHILCTDRVRYVGDPVAGVVAVSEEIAEDALRLIEVSYEPLPAIFDPLEALDPGAPLLHPDLGSYEAVPFIFPQPGTNVSNVFHVRKGDTDAAWACCDAVVEETYHVPQIQHVPIEPHVAVARWDVSGEVTLWSSTQSPFAQRDLIAQTLGISQGELRVIGNYVGGGFGSKAGVSMEALAVAMAQKVRGRPVKVRMTREEEFFCCFVRQGLLAQVKIGGTRQGQILALQVAYYWDAGAYTEYGVNIVRAAGYSSTGPYHIPNVKTDSYCLYTNHPVGGPMRGFGMPEIHWSIEQSVDRLAEALGVDDVEFRLRNCLKGGDIIVTGMQMHPNGLSECIEKAARAVEWGASAVPSAPHKRRGKGMAACWKAPAMPPNPGSEAWVRFNEDATVSVGLGGQELGQGAFTVAAQVAAQALGVPYEWVRISQPVDTRYSPYEWQTVASRITWSMGNAIKAAAEDARAQILEVVARYWGEEPADLDIREGEVISYRSEQSLPLDKMVIYGLPLPDDAGWIGGPIIGRGKFMPTYVTGLDAETGQGQRAVVHYTTGAQAVEVEVDTETGQVEILRLAAVYDVGKAINPEQVYAQLEGGVVQGASSALLEALQLRQGQPLNPSFTDYRIMTSVDAPRRIISDYVEEPQDDGPWGARGVGEHPMIATAPAIANAISDALGIRFNDMPLTAEKIYMALQEHDV